MAKSDDPSDRTKGRLRDFKLGLRSGKTDHVGAVLGVEGALGADQVGEPGHALSQWLADRFNHNFDAYDKAIDSVYNATSVGGSRYHHLVDGQHDVWGAFQSAHAVGE